MLRSVRKAPDQVSGCFHDHLTGSIFTVKNSQILQLNSQNQECIHHLPIFTSQQYVMNNQCYDKVIGSKHRLILMDGKGTIDTSARMFSSSSESLCMIRSQAPIQEKTCWEFYAPVFLYGIQFGVCSLGNNGRVHEKVIEFNSSTPRTVTFLAQRGVIKTWVNHSCPARKRQIEVEYTQQKWFPFVKIRGQGITIIYNPFTSTPNSAITLNNPFNTHQIDCETEKILSNGIKVVEGKSYGDQIKDVIQIDGNKMLVISQKLQIKLYHRNQKNSRIQFNQFYIDNENKVHNLFKTQQWDYIVNIGSHLKLQFPKLINKQLLNKNGAISLNQACALVKYLVITIDAFQPNKKYEPQFQKISHLVTQKYLPILSAYMNIPNPIHMNFDQTTDIFFPHLISYHIQNKTNYWNRLPWFQLKQGSQLIEVSENYLCVFEPAQKQSQEIQAQNGFILIYLIGQGGFKQIFKHNLIISDQADESFQLNFRGKNQMLNNLVSNTQIKQSSSFWRQKTNGPSIYKILQTCFNNNISDNENKLKNCNDVFELNQSQLIQMTNDYNIEKDSAIEALEECGSVEEALLWLSDPNRKTSRKKKMKYKKEQSGSLQTISKKISMLEMIEDKQVIRLILRICNMVYIVGVDPETLTKKYLQKTEKGMINLSNFSYCIDLQQIDFQKSWFSYANHCEIKILDCIQMKSLQKHMKDFGLIYQQNKICFVYEDHDMPMKTQISLKHSAIYTKQTCVDISSPEPFSQDDFIPLQSIKKLISGQCFIVPDMSDQKSIYYAKDLSLHMNNKFYSSLTYNYSVQDKSTHYKISLQNLRDEICSQKSTGNSEYVPLIVQNGPPGCNMNYPICSILYPRSAQPFLANYPFSLTFRHLHRKYLNINEVIINRMENAKKNVNQIKQGYVYFSNHPSIINIPHLHDENNLPNVSKKYKFTFEPNQKECKLFIEQPNYWQYMIIEPLYSKIKKLPFEIGFVGAKGTSLDAEIYLQQMKSKIEKNLHIVDRQTKQKMRYQIQQINEHLYGITTIDIEIMNSFSKQSNLIAQTDKYNIIQDYVYMNYNKKQIKSDQEHVNIYEILTLSPDQMLKVMVKPLFIKKKNSFYLVKLLTQIAKNEQISFKDYNQSQIRKFIDIWNMDRNLDVKTNQKLINKIMDESTSGRKYLLDLWGDIGKGYYTLKPEYIGTTLLQICHQFDISQIQDILLDILKSIKSKTCSESDKIHEINIPYLLYEKQYYSSYYYQQLYEYHTKKNFNRLSPLQQNEQNICFALNRKVATNKCEDIYSQERFINKMEAVILREEYMRKIFVKVKDQKLSYSFRNMVLRFDKSQLHCKAIINIYAYPANQNKRLLLCREVIHQHQWIQIAKNPYRTQMQDMFKQNRQWLNAYGVKFPQRVHTNYFEIEIMFSTNGLIANKREKQNLPSIDIIPELYGRPVEYPLAQIDSIEQRYFMNEAEQKFFITKLPIYLNLTENSIEKQEIVYDKYLINKNNSLEFHLYETSKVSNQVDDRQKINEKAIVFRDKLESLINSDISRSQKIDQMIPVINAYHEIMQKINQNDQNSLIKITHRPTLDYFKTLLLLLLQTIIFKKIKISQKACKQIGQIIIKKQIGPLAISAFFAIAHDPNTLLQSMNHIYIIEEDQSLPETPQKTMISRQILQHYDFPIEFIDKIQQDHLKSNEKIVDSLINLLVSKPTAEEASILLCLNFFKISSKNIQNYKKINTFVFKLKPIEEESFLFFKTSKTLNKALIEYLVNAVQQDYQIDFLIKNFVNGLSQQEMELLILQVDAHIKEKKTDCQQKLDNFISLLISELFIDRASKKKSSSHHIQIISIILSLKVTLERKWQYLSESLELFTGKEQSNQCEAIILSEFLSIDSLQNPQQIHDLVIYHRQILDRAALSNHHSEMFVGFLKNLFQINKQIFIDVILNMPKEAQSLHSSIISLVVKILVRFCNFGGIQGAKLLGYSQNLWLSVSLKLLNLFKNSKNEFRIPEKDIQQFVYWYLQNNSYEKNITNPVIRSQAVQYMTNLSENVLELLTKSHENSPALVSFISIKNILEIFNIIKERIKKDSYSLKSSKFLLLNRIKAGVSKLLENSVNNEQLIKLFAGHGSQKGTLQAMLDDLLQQIEANKRSLKKNNLSLSWNNLQQKDFAQDIQGYTIQGTKQIDLNVKDWQSYKAGSKSFVSKIGLTNKKLILKSKAPINLTKFTIGLLIQDTPQKNNILPDSLQLYGSTSGSSILRKICDLSPIQDQNYYQFGVKVFGINFNTLIRKYKNIQKLDCLVVKFHCLAQPSCSDILQNYQKTKKNGLIYISFLSMLGYQQEPSIQPSYTQIYMKLLSFLGQKEFTSTIMNISKNCLTTEIKQKMIKVLSEKGETQHEISVYNSGFEVDANQILVNLSKNGINVLQNLLSLECPNTLLIKRILKNDLCVKNIDLVLKSIFQKNCNEQSLNSIIQSIKLCGYKIRSSEKVQESIFSSFDVFSQKIIAKYKKICEQEKDKNLKIVFEKLIACILATPEIFELPLKDITNVFLTQGYYRLVSQYIIFSKDVLNWLIYHQKISDLSRQTLNYMRQFKKNGTHRNQIEQIMCLICSVSSYKPIKDKLLHNTKEPQLDRFPLKVLELLQNKQKLLEQYPISNLKVFINFFKNTCASPSAPKFQNPLKEIETNCSQDFAQKLIQLMVRLPQVSSQYHHLFIHEFFFPLINAYEGIPINFIWKESTAQQTIYLNRPTQILEKLPIRPNNDITVYKKTHYRIQRKNWQYVIENDALLFLNDQPICYKSGKSDIWHDLSNQGKKYTTCCKKEWEIFENNNSFAISHAQKQESQFKVYVRNDDLKSDLLRLLTNQTLLKVEKPTFFGKNYLTDLPFSLSGFDHLYWLPLQITPQQFLKQVTICGFKLNQQTINKLEMRLIKNGSIKSINNQKSLADHIKQFSNWNNQPVLEIQIEASDLFKNSTVQTISKQYKFSSQEDKSASFVPQQTIFKVFESLGGLEKMIKVMMSCVKNWASAQQSKIWLQYLNQLQSFSCFPVFSSIYMTKQQNVDLLFSILSGLPDKQDSKKWLQNEKKNVKNLYQIIKNVFEVQGQQAKTIRQFAIQKNFYQTMLERLHLVSKEPKRHRTQIMEQQQQIQIPEIKKKLSQQQYTKQIKKKKGVGYGTDSSTNAKWDITGHEEAKKQISQQIHGLFKILQKFLDYPDFKLPNQILQSTYNSALLPILQSSLRGGSLLQISKSAQLFRGQLKFIQIISKKEQLIPCLMQIPKYYEPKQPESIFSLLKTLEGTSKIFLSCLTGSASQKISQQIAKNILETFSEVQSSIVKYNSDHIDEDQEKKILELPLAKKYPILMKDLRFDYVDMKDSNGKMKHHYNSSYQSNHTSPAAKTIRLAQQLADISHALPIDHTNAIYVRCDKQRVDYMQALIMGSNGTPYAHGAYLFDIYFQDSYPNNPPKVNLTTTGSGSIRFNPNLYACGKVCLSLLGTWRGSAMENWDSKVSTLLQVLVSIQSIIMAQDVYFNQPGFQHEQGTVEGQKKNQAYSNIVRYGNIKFAMLQNIKNPPKGFETIIKRHFYLKKDEIIEECKKWLKYAQKREASYNGLVSDHNSNWSNTFKKKDQYKKMLEKAINQLQQEFKKLQQPSSKDLKKPENTKNQQKLKKDKKKIIQQEPIEQIDVTYQQNKSKSQPNYKQMDINDEKVKDRWSRYIGAMGIQAVNKQSKASILLFGLSSLGIQIAKNIVLSGCKKFTICDNQKASYQDLSGQFYLSEEDIGKNRVQACLYKLQQLNNYVRVDSIDFDFQSLDNKDETRLMNYDVIISTCHNFTQIIKLNEFCRLNKIKFISTKCVGPYGYVLNDFGQNFEVTDKNGEQTVECMIQNITNQQEGIVRLPQGQRHPYQDGQAVIITKIKGMYKKQSQDQTINGSIHRIKVIDKNSFKIGDTSKYTCYQGNGLVRNMKLPIKIDFKDINSVLNKVKFDDNLQYYDFSKGMKNHLLFNCFKALSTFQQKNGCYPKPWDWNDSEKLIQYIKSFSNKEQNQKVELQKQDIRYIRKFSFTCSGNFAPLCAFYGGLIAQQTFKAITSKYMPINQTFVTQFSEIIPQLPQKEEEVQKYIQNLNYIPKQDRFEGLRIIVGQKLLKKIRECRVFVIGSGAIGCQLLKNYAMINLATSQQKQKGQIIVTDPDHIQTSNLNRQFLFRQKHIQKPKSATAAAAVKQMNKYLKQYKKIKVKLLKVCQATKDIFSNQFFESLDIVTNALDNVQARQYVDMRCVQNKVALLESGTLSSKGHVQVIIPYKTQTYGSKADPAEDGQIPHCTLKMFPEQTLHCVEWARDIFGKNFTMKPKALQKLIQNIKGYEPNTSEKQMLRDCLSMLQNKPNNFDDAVSAATKEFWKFYRNDIKQLLYTYPLDAKGKDGKDFWKLPKRPPSPIEVIECQNALHRQFITTFAVMLCKIFNIPFPKDFRTTQRQIQIAKQAKQFEIEQFVPSDKLAKQMAEEVDKKQQDNQQEMIEQKITDILVQDEPQMILKNIKAILSEQKQMGNQIIVKPEQFQKDQDSNGHIDLIYSMANLRAANYKLDYMDWITTKLKAGRITPALSTTTSCIAGLQTIQLIKYLAKLPLEQMKNCFLNLAIPIIQSGEPGEVQVIKIHEDLKTNIWERWSIEDVNYQDLTMQNLINKIQQKYKIIVRGLSVVAGGPIFSDLVLGLASKAEQKKKFMTKKFKDVIIQEGTWQENKFVDLTLVMALEQQFVKHVPTIRINFKK